MKEILNRIWKKKIFGSVGIAAVLIGAILYLWGLFVNHDGVLEFNKTDALFLFILAIMGLFICAIVIYLVFDRNRHIHEKNELNMMLMNILSAINEHDTNSILFDKITQDMMVKLHMKIINDKGGVINEESNIYDTETKEFH